MRTRAQFRVQHCSTEDVMSSSSEQLSPGLFVVRPATAQVQAAGLARLEGKASVSPLGGRLPGWVVKLNKLPRSAREGWRSLHRLLGNDFLVMPALVDERGECRYPNGLEFVSRAKFTRQQALFRPTEGSEVFLPDVSGRIENDAHVEAVWFDAESAFHRS
jgi:hypothetical protein